MIVEQNINEHHRWFEEYLDKTQPVIDKGIMSLSIDTLRTVNPRCVQNVIQNPC